LWAVEINYGVTVSLTKGLQNCVGGLTGRCYLPDNAGGWLVNTLTTPLEYGFFGYF